MKNNLHLKNLLTDKNYFLFSEFIRNIGNEIYFSQAGQDLFVIAMLEGKRRGNYLEIGGADPYLSNNTFILELIYDWKGFSIEFNESLVYKYNKLRSNICIFADATQFDYLTQCQNLSFPTQIDYLSVDIDPACNTYDALIKCPFDKYRFSVITYEHDSYSSGEEYAFKSREFLRNNGYVLVVKNIKCFGRTFEDWWVDPSVIPKPIYQRFLSENIEFSELFY
jgi:hypothetical protein